MPENVETQNPVVTVDPVVGKNAIALLMPHYEKISEDLLLSPTVDVFRAALKVSAAHGGLSPEMQARFEALPAREYDRTLLPLLGPAAQAVIHTREQLVGLQTIDPNARLPFATAQRALELREVMLGVLSYHLGDDPEGPNAEAVRELQYLRRGHGYRDLAADLSSLSGLYGQFAERLADDKRRYKASDALEAEQLATTIRAHLGKKQSKRRSPDELLAARAWTFMVNTYEETAATARWLFRREPAAASLFPPLGEGRRRRAAPTTQPGEQSVPSASGE